MAECHEPVSQVSSASVGRARGPVGCGAIFAGPPHATRKITSHRFIAYMVAFAPVRCSLVLVLIACHHDAPPPAAPAEPPPPCETVGDCTIKATEALDKGDRATATAMYAHACAM